MCVLTLGPCVSFSKIMVCFIAMHVLSFCSDHTRSQTSSSGLDYHYYMESVYTTTSGEQGEKEENPVTRVWPLHPNWISGQPAQRAPCVRFVFFRVCCCRLFHHHHFPPSALWQTRVNICVSVLCASRVQLCALESCSGCSQTHTHTRTVGPSWISRCTRSQLWIFAPIKHFGLQPNPLVHLQMQQIYIGAPVRLGVCVCVCKFTPKTAYARSFWSKHPGWAVSLCVCACVCVRTEGSKAGYSNFVRWIIIIAPRRLTCTEMV